MALTNSLKATQQVSDQFSQEPDTQKVVKLKSDVVQFTQTSCTQFLKSYGESWVVGTSTNGVVGTNTGTQGGGQQVVGSAGRVASGTQTLV